ncbi:MAG: glycine cleavage system aminomethyltransferase GcvT [Acidimicrobiales bacterium]
MESRRSPLDAAHRALGAKMVPFGGWDMPLSYPSGTVEEHLACRSSAVVFDVSHLGTVRVAGPGSFALLQSTLTNDLRRIAPGRAQYTHLLDEADASVLDDIIVWWVAGEPGTAESRFDVMPNASNTDRVSQALCGPGVTTEDVTATRAVLAVQGPHARRLLSGLAPDAATVPRFGVMPFAWQGVEGVAAGTGYTGEDGLELAVPAAAAPALWEAIIAAGIRAAGLGARDTLRLEAGLPLHGHELGAGITPLQAGLGWVVAWSKPDFRGRAALARERERGVDRRMRGIRTDGRQPPREGHTVVRDGMEVGVVTSGNFSPVLGCGIALALVRPDLAPGDSVAIVARGRELPGRIVPLPFVGGVVGVVGGKEQG